MGAQIEMEILFGGETADQIARPNRGSIQTMGPVKVSGEKRITGFYGRIFGKMITETSMAIDLV
jgi:hypothetical protein